MELAYIRGYDVSTVIDSRTNFRVTSRETPCPVLRMKRMVFETARLGCTYTRMNADLDVRHVIQIP